MINKKERGSKRFTFIDLFAGIGGTRIGLELVGGKCVFSSERDKHCQKTYEKNFGEKPAGDINSIKVSDISDFDVLVAGFPCQPFSTMGRRQGFRHKTQGSLFYNILKILKYSKRDPFNAKAFLLENVKGLYNHDNGKTFSTIYGLLDKIGYSVFYDILDAADFGVPQHRKRIYIVGFRKDLFPNVKFKLPKTNGKVSFINEYLEKNVSGYSITKHLQQVYLKKMNDSQPLIVDENSKIQVNTLVASYHKIQRLTGTFVRDGETGLRLLSENECKAIMGFNKEVIKRDFVFPVSRTQMYHQLGNSVAVPVIVEIANKIKNVIT